MNCTKRKAGLMHSWTLERSAGLRSESCITFTAQSPLLQANHARNQD
jgi:hypothetical protein